MPAEDYPFLDVFWTMLVFFAWILWFYLLYRVIGDVFRRHDLSGSRKVGWIIVALLLPFLGVFAYLVAHSDGMAERDLRQAQAAQAQLDEWYRG